MGGSSPQPDVVHPGEAAQAAVGTAGAGEMMSIADQPIEQYANLATTSALGPAEIQTQTALQNRAALQAAQAQQDVQARTDPLAYAQRQMRLAATTQRLGQLTGQDPSAFGFNAPGIYGVPGTVDLPTLAALRAQGAQVASNLSTASVDRAGGNPQLTPPGNPQDPELRRSLSYLT